jgi:hypothetical protein
MRGVCSHVKRSTTFTSPQRRASTTTLINTIEIENMYYSNIGKVDRLLLNGHQYSYIYDTKQKDWAGYSSTMYTYRHTYMQCVPTLLGDLKTM